MSWFDASGLASIAKSALKEAQRTIDKALDIKEDVNDPASTPIDTNSEDFFSTWGVTQSGNISDGNKQDNRIEDISKGNKVSASLWGSFTGSFFDASKHPATNSAFIDSLDDSNDTVHEQFNTSKLVVQHSDDGELPQSYVNKIEDVTDSPGLYNFVEYVDSHGLSEDQPPLRHSDKTSPSQSNRLSIVSNDSCRISSESVELLAEGSGCATSPDSDRLSSACDRSESSSAQESKQTSDSVEVLGYSQTSPSSVEVIESDSSSSRRYSQLVDAFDPSELSRDENPNLASEKTTPDSIEVIPEDQDDNSIADDTMSYTSASESTSTTVLDSVYHLHMKPQQKLLKDTFNKPDHVHESILVDISSSPEKSMCFTDAITRAPSRGSMHLPLPQVNQVFIDTQPQSSMQGMPSILTTSNVIDIPVEDEAPSNLSVDNLLDSSNDGSQSDKTITGENPIESSCDSLIGDGSQSLYLSSMLAEAMVEKSDSSNLAGKSSNFDEIDKCMSSSQSNATSSDISIVHVEMPARESSPLSSESRSDLVKIGSDQTSGDELETTTSSDIEIISSPNGDSSCAQSRQSPAKQHYIKGKSEDSQVNALLCKMTMKKVKGHNRELSGASSISDESLNCEIDRLQKRLSELTEILEFRETKLIEVNRKNVELEEFNNDLRHQLDGMLTKQLETSDLSLVTEEYTQRLSALEKKFQQAIREKDILRKQLEQSKQEVSKRMDNTELEALISEKDEVIEELREEGEKLSKHQLQLSNIIKKLRNKEKDNESIIKNLRETIEDLSTETERLKRSLSAKEEVERTQIEAVHQLTSKNKKQEIEINKLRSQLDDLTEKYDSAKKSLDAAKKELLDKNRASNELHAREQMLESLENEKRITESQNEEIMNQLEDLRARLRQTEQEFIRKEQTLRNENHELLRRVDEAETRNEKLSQAAIEISQPLVRQLETLQATHNMKLSAFEKQEQEMISKIQDLQSKVHNLSIAEKAAKEECISLRSKFADVEGKWNRLTNQFEMLQIQLEQQKAEKQIVEQEYKRIIEETKGEIKEKNDTIIELQNKVSSLQKELTVEKESSEVERKRRISLQEQARDKTELVDRGSPQTGSNSPTLSIGKAESLGSSLWDEPLEFAQVPRYTNVFEMQMLQSNLKQREGEVQQLQWELNRREQERSLLNSEISSLLTRLEEVESKVKDYDNIKSQFEEVQQQYETLCQLYGEKVEENEELKLDLVDVKDMYKGQIDELLRQQRQQQC